MGQVEGKVAIVTGGASGLAQRVRRHWRAKVRRWWAPTRTILAAKT